MLMQIRKPENDFLGVMKRKMQKKDKDKIEAIFAERKQNMNSFEIKMLKGNLIIWNKYRWNIQKWIFGKLISLTF